MKDNIKDLLKKAAEFFAIDGKSEEVSNGLEIPEELSKFHSVSITGRYIYGHLCLMQMLDHFNCPPLPQYLEEHLRSFLTVPYLNEYFNISYYLYGQEVFSSDNTKKPDLSEADTDETEEYVPKDVVQELRQYSENCPKAVSLVIDNLMWIGIGNLYGGYRSEYTLPYLVSIIKALEEEHITLPAFDIVAHISANENNGWGNRTDPQMLKTLLR